MEDIEILQDWVTARMFRGQYIFTKEDVQAIGLPISDEALINSLVRMGKRGVIMSPWQNFYVTIPTEYKLKGIVPPSFDCKGIWPFRKRTAETSQLVNPDVCEYRDNQYKVDVGTSMRHEITESFEAGKICISEGISCGPSWRDWCGVKINGTDDHVYELAHGRATPQAATVRARLDEIRAQKRAEARNALQGSGFNPHPTRR